MFLRNEVEILHKANNMSLIDPRVSKSIADIIGDNQPSVVAVLGLLILVTLVTFIVLFVLWRKGKVLQQGVANERMRQVSNAFDNVRRMTVSAVRRSAFFVSVCVLLTCGAGWVCNLLTRLSKLTVHFVCQLV